MERFVVGIIFEQYVFCPNMPECLCAGSAVLGGKEGGWLPSQLVCELREGHVGQRHRASLA